MSFFKRTVAPENSPVVLMDRVYGESKALITQAAIDTITYRVFEYATREDADGDRNREEVGEEAELTPADVIYDTLQTAAPWDTTKDAAGYNFRFTLPGARRPTGGYFARVEVWLTPSTSGEEAYPLVWIIEAKPIASA